MSGEEVLQDLARLVRRRNKVAAEIAALIGRLAQIGHVGEYIASRVFGISLERSASAKGLDGRFARGELAGRSVDIKFSTKHDGLLNVKPEALPDFYLVMVGPKTGPVSSRGTTRPWCIETVYLFDAPRLLQALSARGVKMGVATSVRRELWEVAEVYPSAKNERLAVSAGQRSLLELFGCE